MVQRIGDLRGIYTMLGSLELLDPHTTKCEEQRHFKVTRMTLNKAWLRAGKGNASNWSIALVQRRKLRPSSESMDETVP